MSPASTAFVVGIGASAGGVEALEHFFAGIPPSPNMSFIVVTHLGSGRTSHMPDIIGRHTALPVHSAQDDMLVENNQIYVLAEMPIFRSVRAGSRLQPRPAPARDGGLSISSLRHLPRITAHAPWALCCPAATPMAPWG